MMFMRLSAVTSATIATIFDVPMSSATMRFLLSLTMLFYPRDAFLDDRSLPPDTRAANPLR